MNLVLGTYGSFYAAVKKLGKYDVLSLNNSNSSTQER